MTSPNYPSSLDVSPGQPTSIVQYNRLRADALLLGAAPADAVNLGSFLSSYVFRVSISLTWRRTACGSCMMHTSRPRSMIRGVMCQANANVDLPANSFSGGAADWYIFANRTAGSPAFTLNGQYQRHRRCGPAFDRCLPLGWRRAGFHIHPDLCRQVNPEGKQPSSCCKPGCITPLKRLTLHSDLPSIAGLLRG